MAEKITIAELDINTDALLKSATETKKAMDALKEENKELKKSTEDTTKAQVKNEAALKNLTTKYNQQKKVLAAVTDENNDLTKAQKSLDGAINKTIKTETEATANSVKLLALRKDVNTTTEKGRKQIELINAKIDENNELLKENASKSGKAKLSVGGYADGIKEAFGDLGIFGVALNKVSSFQDKFNTLVTGSGKSFKAASKGTSGASKALRIFKVALISAGIGLIIVALGAFVALLSKTQKFTDAVNVALSSVGAVIDVLVGTVAKLASVFSNLFSQPLSKTFKEVGEAVDGLSDSMVEAAKKGAELERLRQSVKRLGFEFEVANAKARQQIELLTAIADDNTKSFAERKKANREAIKAEEKASAAEFKLFKTRKDLADAEFERLKATGNINDEAREAHSNATKEFIEAETQRLLTQRDLEKQRTELKQDELERDLDIIKDGFESFQATKEKELSLSKTTAKQRAAIINEIQTESEKSIAEQVKTLQQFSEQQIDINDLVQESDSKVLNSKIRALELSEIIEGRLLEVVRDRRVVLSDLADLEEETDEKRKERETKRIEEEKKTSEDKLKNIQAFENQKRELQNQIDLENTETQEEKEILKAEQELEKKELALEQLQLDEEQKTELLALLQEQQDLRLAEIKESNAEKLLKSEEAIEKKRIAIKNKAFDAAVSLAGAETKIGQGILAVKEILAAKEAILELKKVTFKSKTALANSSTAIAEGTAETAKVGFPQNIPLLLGFAAQAIGIISAVKSAAKIGAGAAFYGGGQVPDLGPGRINKSANIPTQRGGDNILATVKTGEVILNGEQQQRAGGSAFFKSIGVPGFQGGGQVGPTPTQSAMQAQQINMDEFANVITDRINAIKIVAIEQDITDAQAIQAEIVGGANI